MSLECFKFKALYRQARRILKILRSLTPRLEKFEEQIKGVSLRSKPITPTWSADIDWIASDFSRICEELAELLEKEKG